MQKAAATVATVLSIATAGQDSVASQSISTSIIDSFVEKITTTTVPLNLGNPLIIGSIIDTASSTLGSLSTPIVLTNSIVSDIATASETIAKSLDIEGISASQKTAMDSTPNTAPWMTAPTLSSSSDTGFIGDGKSSDTTPEINFKTMTGVNLSYTVNDGASQTVSTSTTSESHAISLSELQEGNNTIIVTATSGEESTIRKITYNLDTLAPATIATSGFVITDTAGASATDLITSNPTIILTLASDTVSWQYSLDGTTFTNGTGNTITLADRSYQKQDIQVKQFDVAGNSSVSVMASPMVQLEALGNTTGYDHAPQITAVGTAGEYVVTFYGIDSAGDYSIFVQKFNANGTISGDMVQLEALGNTTGYDYNPQITAVGTAGEYVVTFCGDDSAGDRSIFVQKFNADGTISGDMVQLEALGNTTGDNYVPQITAVGTAGEYVVTFDGYDSAGDYSIFVQKFNANGTISGDMVQLEALGNTTGYDFSPQITAVGTAGEYVVTFYGIDSAG
jgi:roadblock/LC7 domain-containing protein